MADTELVTPPQAVTLPRPNLPLLRKVLEHIDAHPEEWRQGSWASGAVCGTAYCVAGHALVMDGTHVLTYDPHWGLKVDGLDYVTDSDGDEIEAPGYFGREVLGLTHGEGLALFAGGNSRETVQLIAERVAERAGERL